MKNQVLQALLKIEKRLNNYRQSDNSISKILEDSASEIEFLKNKFSISSEEALFLSAICIKSIGDSHFVFDVDDISSLLSISNLEFLLFQKSFQSLIDKDFLSEYTKQPTRFSSNEKSILPIFTKEFSLNSSFAEYIV